MANSGSSEPDRLTARRQARQLRREEWQRSKEPVLPWINHVFTAGMFFKAGFFFGLGLAIACIPVAIIWAISYRIASAP